jgi:hypothetical protein
MINADLSDEIPKSQKKINRSDLMGILGRVIKHLDNKAIAGRLTNADTEKMRDSKTRLLIEAIKTHGSLIKDEQLETIEARLRALEERS